MFNFLRKHRLQKNNLDSVGIAIGKIPLQAWHGYSINHEKYIIQWFIEKKGKWVFTKHHETFFCPSYPSGGWVTLDNKFNEDFIIAILASIQRQAHHNEPEGKYRVIITKTNGHGQALLAKEIEFINDTKKKPSA